VNDMTEIQTELEARMASLGVERFRRSALEARQTGQATRSRSVQQVLDVVIDPLASAILRFREEAKSGKAGRKHSAVRLLHGIEAEALAFITGKLVLDGTAQSQNLTRLSVRLGGAVELEQRLRRFGETHAKTIAGTLMYLDGNTRNEEHRRRVMLHMLSEGGDDWDPWSDKDRLLAGTKLVELLVEATGLFELEMRFERKKRILVLEATQRFRDWVATMDLQFEVMSPEFLPCVIPPKPWDGLVGGGYHTKAFAYPLQLVKTRHKAHKQALQKADLSQVLAAVNSIQNTAWTIETRTLEVAKALVGAGSEKAGLPPASDHPLPSKPVDIDTNEEARRAWKRDATQVYGKNRSLTSKRLLVLKALAIAGEFAQYPAIYFPHQLDFRGRVYAVPQVLNPQGSDLAKGLLVFAEGAQIDTPEALDWFFIHGANSFGVDKVSMEERIQWVKDNQRDILAAAAEPLDHLWWADADSPFVFLTWCFEFAEWVRNPDFLSRVPIAMDGSCNGLQHYSAMLQDPVGGKATNLVPSDKPQDIYAEVAKAVMAGLYHEAMMEHHPQWDWVAMTDEDRKEISLANAWGAFGIDRKITKRPVMVLPYGGTLSSCQKYVLEAVQSKIAGGAQNPFGDELVPACNWLGSRVWEGIGQVVVAARLAMGWLQDVTRVVSAEGKPLEWTTPSGFVVVQAYPEVRSHRIDTVILGTRFQPQLSEEVPATLDRRRQVNGVAPNFVHSLDAAALTLTVNHASDRVRRFAMIHDSYGTTAAEAPALARALRESFVAMYSASEHVLERFQRDVVPKGLLNKVPGIPFVGGLDLSAVLGSKYFFA
jgi:DNA-directed RNA polymerase